MTLSALDALLDDDQRSPDLPKWTQTALPTFDPTDATAYARSWLRRIGAGGMTSVVMPHAETGEPQRTCFYGEQLLRPLAFMQAGLVGGVTWLRRGTWQMLTAERRQDDEQLELRWDEDSHSRRQSPRTSPWSQLHIASPEFDVWQTDVMPLFADDLSFALSWPDARLTADHEKVVIEEGDERVSVSQSAHQLATLLTLFHDDKGVYSADTWGLGLDDAHPGLEATLAAGGSDVRLSLTPDDGALTKHVLLTPGMLAQISAKRLR